MSDLAYSDGIVLFSNNYCEMQSLLEGGTSHAAAVVVFVYVKGMSALIHDEQRQAVLLDVESLQGVGKFKHLCSGYRKD